jgi:hypothetical protein
MGVRPLYHWYAVYSAGTDRVVPVRVIVGRGDGVMLTAVLAESTFTPPLYRYIFTVWLPEFGKHILAGLVVAVAMVAPGQLNLKLSTVPVLVLVNVMQLSSQAVVALAVIDASMTVVAGVRSDTLSTAKDGSVPAPSSLFTHLNPIFTLGLLLADEGRLMLVESHLPCPLVQVVVLAGVIRRLHVAPLSGE